MDVTRQYATFDALRRDIPPRDADWLTPAELAEGRRWRDAKRRESWRGGRWLGKRLIARRLNLAPADFGRIAILSHNRQTALGQRPQVLIDGRPALLALSLSHSARGVLSAVAGQPDTAVGVDLTDPADVQPRFLAGWFTPRERRRFDTRQSAQAAALWAIKEAVYKACHTGERFDPRRIEIFRTHTGAYSCHYGDNDLGRSCRIEARSIDGHAAAVVLRRKTIPSNNGQRTTDN